MASGIRAAEAPPSTRRLRADAERSVEFVLSRAPAVLARDPTASMADVAEAAGVARATLYRHFPTREELLAAIHLRALEDAVEAVFSAQPESGPVPDALRRVLEKLMEVGDRFSFLTREREHRDERTMRAEQELGAALIALVERGQRESAFDTGLSPRFVARSLGALLLSTIEAVAAGELERAKAPATVARTLLSGLAPR